MSEARGEGAAASGLLRAGLLEGVGVLQVVPAGRDARAGSPAVKVGGALAGLGARVHTCEAPAGAEGGLAQERATLELERALVAAGELDVLVLDAAGLFAQDARAGGGAGEDAAPRAALGACLQSTWTATRAFAAAALLERERGGRVIYVSPRAGAGEHSPAARAGLENLARTLSVEWARHAITVVALAPGAGSTADEVAAITAYLASPAGAYFSGCVLELSGAVTARE